MFLIMNEDPISVKHISWFTKEDHSSDDIVLYEVVETSYSHPDVPNHLSLKNVEIRVHGSAKRTSEKADSWILLEASLRVVSQLTEIYYGDKTKDNS